MKKRLTIDEKKRALRDAGRKVRNTLTDAEVNKQYKEFRAETSTQESPPQSNTPESYVKNLDIPITEDEPLMDEEMVDNNDATAVEITNEVLAKDGLATSNFGALAMEVFNEASANRLRVPLRHLHEFCDLMSAPQVRFTGDKDPVIVEWCRSNFTAGEFEHKYAHRGIK